MLHDKLLGSKDTSIGKIQENKDKKEISIQYDTMSMVMSRIKTEKGQKKKIDVTVVKYQKINLRKAFLLSDQR